MKKLSIILTALLFNGFMLAQEGQPPARPNIIVLFADDMGYGDLGSYGHPTIETPNLDRMADEGVRMTQFYVAAPVCTPSRAGLLTGRLPIRSGMCGKRQVLFPNSGGGLPQEEVTIARALKEVGYSTACVGKWHLGHQHPYLPTDHGFDYYFGIPYSNDMSPEMNDWDGARAFPPTPLLENDQVIEREPDQSLLTPRYTEKALQFIEQHRDDPFFLYLPYTFPHIPIFASDAFRGTSRRGLYGDVISEIDWSVGQVLSKVKELGLQENTLVFFTSDNGPWLVKDFEGGSAGLLRDGKGSTWDGGMREPAIAWWPGTLPAGVVNHNVATSLDLFPTTTALGGWQRPDTLELDGEDILDLLKGGEPKQDDSVYFYRTDKLYAMRKGPWKAHFTTIEGVYEENRIEDHTPPLLFNLERDPSETVNLASEYPQVVAEMVALRTEHETGVTKRPSQLIEWLKPADQVFKIKRGTNISHWLSQSRWRGEERLTFFTREDVEFLAGIGFDHLRIPIDEEQMWNEEGEKNEEAFQLLDNALDWCAEFNLRAIVDLHILRSHHFNAEEKPLWTEPSAQEHFLELWRDLSAHLKDRPVTQVAYEPMNEPVADNPEDWNNLVAKAVSVIRENELERIIFIGSNRWQQTETFDQLRIPSQDPNIYLSFHFYEPFALTHHQASWTGIKDYKGPVRYPGKTVLEKDLVGLAEDLVRTMRPHTKHFDRQMIVDLIQKPLALARKTGLPLYCGEWGALPTVPEKDRLQWYSDMRSVLEERGIAWTTWDYKGGFGIVDGERKPRQKLIDVLLK